MKIYTLILVGFYSGLGISQE
ncbi:MAG: hypothetical protein RLZZ29_1663, partial [Cyanobacteriota bacterium]